MDSRVNSKEVHSNSECYFIHSITDTVTAARNIGRIERILMCRLKK